MHVLDTPAAFDELAGQPVEQFRVRRPSAPNAQIAWRCNDAAAEVMLPEAIHQDAGRQWVVLAGDPVRQRRPPAGARWPWFDPGGLWLVVRRQDDREASLNFLAGMAQLPAFQQESL